MEDERVGGHSYDDISQQGRGEGDERVDGCTMGQANMMSSSSCGVVHRVKGRHLPCFISMVRRVVK